MAEVLHFKISAALKDIIGRDLITDDFVAIFELVKNSYDAYASRVDIYIENLYSERPKIIIKDNGKGMNHDDLINKWLFVAYSAKREGTEDNTFDYRDKISVQRAFAGAKGIGRFSCDRLGRRLNLETTKLENNPTTQVLITEWEKFEKDLQTEFIDISVLHETKSKSDFGLEHGTVLEICELRSEWDRGKLLKLKESLSKLINPNNQKEKEFSIHFHVPDLIASDKEYNDSYERINGEVENFIFDTLNLKTTKITTSIAEDGFNIETELIDGGTLIYRIKEKNKFQLLKGIKYTLYYLNRSAKYTFARKMGLAVASYGNIFLYKNGFRIYPFGEPGEDPLKVNLRKAQGYARYLGLRDLIGQIEINNDDNELRETSSRGDGLIKTDTYFQVEECFWEILKRLEKYVVDIQQWGWNIEENDKLIDKDKISQLIVSLTGSSELLDIQYPDNFLDILESSQSGSAEQVVKNLKKLAFETGNDRLIDVAKKAEKRLNEIFDAKKEAEQEAEYERKRSKYFKLELEEKESENLFLKSVKSQDFNEIVSFMHHIGISSGKIDNYLIGLYNYLDEPEIDILYVKNLFKTLIFENQKILNISRFATRANFKLTTELLNQDIVSYLNEYISNIVSLQTDKSIRIVFSDLFKRTYVTSFRPIELNILVDNLLSNSKKARATEFIIKTNWINNQLTLEFKDNGIGIEKYNLEKVFNFGYTTTSGSGIGLYHVNEVVKRLNAEISIESEPNKFTKIKIQFK